MDPDVRRNNRIFEFHLESPVIEWSDYPSSPTIPIETNSPTVAYTKKPEIPPPSLSKMEIFYISVGSVIFVLTSCVVCSLIYRRMKRNKMKMEGRSGQ